mmetsp:Transcript_61336/g.97172  ORF Transcript_61336/g.97172 Transcript_61336/m.97172 type:complete len:217 (+) Transcript_61336:102-752(+)
MPYHILSPSQSPSQRDCFTSPLADARRFRTHWPLYAAFPQFTLPPSSQCHFVFLALAGGVVARLRLASFWVSALLSPISVLSCFFAVVLESLETVTPFFSGLPSVFFVLRPRMAEASPREEVLATQYAPQRNRKMWLMVPKTCACHLNSSGVIGGATSAALVQYSAPAIATMTQRPATFAGCEPAGKRSRATATRCVSANASITFCALKLNVDTIG